MKSRTWMVITAVLIAVTLGAGNSFAYSTVTTFGDSLSDNGNVSRFTDGALWVELLADSYGADLIDYAYGGATTSEDNPTLASDSTGLLWQIDQYEASSSRSSSADTLVTLWAGANDFLQSRSPYTAVENIYTALETLYNSGIQNFLVPNLPDIGITPAFQSAGEEASNSASFWVEAFNDALATMLSTFSSTYSDANIYTLDTFSLFNQYTVGSTEWQDLFWTDGFHPSSTGHNLIFQAAASALAQTPEPATFLLMGAALLFFFSRKKTTRR